MQSATRLLTDLRSNSALLPYAEDTVRAVLNDVVGLSQGIEARLTGADGGDPSTHALTVVQNFTLRRHKRCLIVYHSARCARVEALRWNTGAVLPSIARDNLCSSEVDYFKAYSEAVSRYLDRTGLDLTASLKPPKLDRIPVLAIQDCGVVQTASGPRTVSRGETHFMSRAEVEPLVRQGLMVQLSE